MPPLPLIHVSSASHTRRVAKPQMLGLAFKLGLWGFGACILPAPRLAGRRVASCESTPTTTITFYFIFTFNLLLFLSFFCFYFIYGLLSLFPCGVLVTGQSSVLMRLSSGRTRALWKTPLRSIKATSPEAASRGYSPTSSIYSQVGPNLLAARHQHLARRPLVHAERAAPLFFFFRAPS